MKRKIKITFQITVVALILLATAMLITGSLIMLRGFSSNNPFTYMIILGNKIEGSEPSPLLTDRIEAAARYMQANPDVIAIATGYQSEKADISEAQCIYNELTKRGIAPERILIDERATSTRENFQYAIEIMEKELGRVPRNIGVLSSEFHLLRAKMIAKSYGIDPVTIAANTTDTEAFFREHLAGEWKEGNRGYRIRNKLHVEFGDRFTWPDTACEDMGDSVFCYGLKDHFGVLCDGTVIPCCLDREGVINLGNIFTDDLDAVLHGQRATALREGFKQRKATEELCRKCGYARRFG
jgi:uncharacterized SAM-binding protein YcdF (DUF218 family)